MAPHSQRAFFQVSPIAGKKRPAPSLLPAFEPEVTSPKLPRCNDTHHAPPKGSRSTQRMTNQLPSAPTSSTFIPTSSSPQLPNKRRQPLQRTVSALSERMPLAILPSIELDEDGKPTLLGRSTNSSHYQLSTNKLISRVHVRAAYIPPTGGTSRQVQIECTGWNGIKVHCQGRAWELYKGDTFTSETDDAELMIDVQDARVLIKWPSREQKVMTPTDSEGTFDHEKSPSKKAAMRTSPVLPVSHISPLRQPARFQSPISPSHHTSFATLDQSTIQDASQPPVHIYEDETHCEEKDGGAAQPTQSTQILTQLPNPEYKNFSDSDEENDPIILSFGPYGANLNGRMEAFSTISSPEVRRPLKPILKESASQNVSPQRFTDATGSPKSNSFTDLSCNASPRAHKAQTKPKIGTEGNIASFVINHLLYSQLSATPLSTLSQHIDSHLEDARDSGAIGAACHDLSPASLHKLLQSTPCIGTVQREGKDAAGKPLESEYYYMPEQDDNPMRQDIVRSLGIGGRGLRNCRKSHKVSHDAFHHEFAEYTDTNSNISGESPKGDLHSDCEFSPG
ncbi:uncharacterized protein KY384_008668 [Bacidia gigantensis]|uniref:uncharacterized protein n=1 Tax=Bacidia gigantensis TaxID=2732470 RepID=UPI001D0552E8|nr:uncharacterized protein KY384_008668 [Bacidia gigantensis]KAG8526468.1 hypothetical protein KY384_008668 [Bacidia gigantensis]